MNAAALAAAAIQPGVYRIEQPISLPFPKEVQHYLLPQMQQVQRASLLDTLAMSLNFPEYFGGNWDAAFDCLTDRDWVAGMVVVIEMPLAPDASIDETALHTLLDLMQDAVYFWFDNKVILYFLIQSQNNNILNNIKLLQ